MTVVGSRLKEDTTQNFLRHNERLNKADSLQSELAALEEQDCNQRHAGLTEHVRSLLDFFMSCSAEP